MSKLKISVLFNFMITALVIIATVFMLNGVYFMGEELLLTEKGLGLFKFFTVQSNVLMGVISFIFMLFEIKVLKEKSKEIPKCLYILKLVFSVGVILTFLTTALFLAPTSTHGYFSLFKNSNLFFHFVIPVLSGVTFVCFEKSDKIKFKYVFAGVLPMLVYGIFYTVNVFIHTVDGNILPEYDWYGFVAGGMSSIFISFPVMLISTFLISFSMWKFNKN